MSGEGGPMAYGGLEQAVDMVSAADPADILSTGRVDVLADIAVSERGAIARRIGAIVAQCQKEAREGVVPLSDIELRLVLLADDVRGGLHGGGA